MRLGPDTSYSVVFPILVDGILIPGKDAAAPTWYQSYFKGWILGENVEVSGDLSTVPEIPPVQLSLKETTWLELNIRSGPGTDHNVLAVIPAGSTTCYPITRRNTAKPNWWEIKYTDTVSGWVHGACVQTYGNTGEVSMILFPETEGDGAEDEFQADKLDC